jgi:hypothetical protein
MVEKKKVVTKLTIGEDKKLHFMAGILTVVIAFLLGVPIFATVLILCGVAVGKEVVDYLGYGTPDIWDAIFTILGGVAILVLWWMAQQEQKRRKEAEEAKKK